MADEQKSVTRQIEHTRQYATRKGWLLADDHVYVDDGISGAEFANRPGFLRLMNALKPRAPFRCSSCPTSHGSGAKRSRPRTH